MSLVLRSSHFLRSLAFVSRKVTLTARTQKNFSLLPAVSSCKSHVTPFTFSQPFATQANVASISNTSPIDATIRKLDEEARKLGRVSAAEIKNILSSLNKSNLPTSTQALMLIRCCGNLLPEETPTTRTQIVQNLWQTFEHLKIPLDVSHYNALLRVYLENEHTFSPTDFLSQLEKKGIEPNRVTYQRLVSKYCQDGNIEGATKILEFMRDKNFPISEGVFNALIYGHSQSNDMTSAEGILAMMSQAGLEPSPQSYTNLMCGYAKQGDMESIRRILAQCESSLVNGDYLEIIHALAVNGHTQLVEELVGKIQPGVGYSADAANHIFHLVNKGQIDTAYRIVKTLARPTNINGEQLPVGGFLIRHMVRTNQPVDKILDVCQRLSEENLHQYAFNLAVQSAVECAGLDTLVTLLREYKSRGGEIRPHYFWPLLTREAKENNTAEVLRILQVAESEFGVGSSQETLRDYVLPYLSPPNQVSSEVFSQLRAVGVSLGVITSSYVAHMLSQHQLREAARVAKAFRARYPKFIIRKVLTPAYLRTQDLKSLVTIVKAVGIVDERGEAEEEKAKDVEAAVVEEEEVSARRTDTKFTGNILLDIFNATKGHENRVQHLELLLNTFVEERIAVSRFTGEYIQNGLQSALTSNISEALSTLTSEEITFKPLQYAPSQFIPKSDRMDPEYTLENIKKLESQGENANSLKRALFTNFIRHKEFEKAMDYLKVLEQDASFTISPGLYVLLIGLASDVENLPVVEHYLNELNTKHPEDKIDGAKALKVAHLFLKHGKEMEMFDLLRKHGRSLEETSSEYMANSAAWRLLNTSAETSNPETVKKLLELLKTQNYVQPNNVILGPLIKAHILKKDYTGAMESFEWCVTQYRATPWKSELCKHFIQNGDTASLQRVTDLSTTIHGELNSLYDLMLCFLDSGRLRQARKILETPGMSMRPERLNQILEYYLTNRAVEKIENLLKVTQDLTNIDRAAIYLNLLELYAASEDVDKALGLWTQMQEDNDTPSEEFLTKLAALLKKNDRPVPFSVPKPSAPGLILKTKAPEATHKEVDTDSKLRNLIKMEKVKEALKYYQGNKSNLNTVSRLQLVPSLLSVGLKSDAHQILTDLSLEDLEQPRASSSIKFVLDRLSTEELYLLSSKVSENMRRLVSFSTYLMKAAVREGNIQQYLDSIKSDIEAAEGNREKLQAVAFRFTMSGILIALENQPQLLPEISELSHQLAKAGFYQPLQGLFNYYYINGLTNEAEQLFENYLLKSETPLRFRSIITHLDKSKDVSLAEPLLNILDKLKDPVSYNYAYPKLLGMALSKDNFPGALSILTRAAEQGASISQSQLDQLQALAAREGQTLPLAIVNKLSSRIQQKRDEANSSSSSSDEDEKEKAKRN